MPTQYDPHVIYQFADGLYKQASSIIAAYTMGGCLVGLAAGYLAGNMADVGSMGAIAGALILGMAGLSIGRQKAFWLKLQAQTALCQVRIEENTRGAVASSVA